MNKLISENEKLLKGIEIRQQSLNHLSSYLSELESQLALIFAASPDVIVFLDKDEKILKVSDAAFTLLGYKREEMIGKFLWDFISTNDVDVAKTHLMQVKQKKIMFFNNTNKFLVNFWIAKNNTLVKLAWRFSLYDEREKQTIGVATDVSYLGFNEKHNIQLLERAINLSTDGIIITDGCENDFQIIFVNPSFEKQTGYTKHEILGQNCRFLQTTNCRNSRAIKTLKRCTENGLGCSVLLENQKKDKTIFYNHLTISAVVDQRLTTNFIGTSKDVSSSVGTLFDWSPNTETGFSPLSFKRYE